MNRESFSLQQVVAEYGIRNLRFQIPLREVMHFPGLPCGVVSSDSPTEPVLCEIDETRYPVKDNYKVTFTPCQEESPDAKCFEVKHFYISDLETIFRRSENDGYRLYVLNGDGYTTLI